MKGMTLLRRLAAMVRVEFQNEFSSKMSLVFFLLLPLLFTFAVGTGLSDMMDDDTGPVEEVRLPLYVRSDDSGPLVDALLAVLAEKGLKGIKDSSFDILTFYAFMRAVRKPGFDFIIGTEALLVSAVVAGADGCVSGVSNTFPELMAQLWNAAKAGEMETAMALQQKVNRIREIMHLSNSIIAMHAMLKIRGMDIGFPRRPLLPADDGLIAKIRQGLEELELV